MIATTCVDLYLYAYACMHLSVWQKHWMVCITFVLSAEEHFLLKRYDDD